MMQRKARGTAIALLCLPLIVGVLPSCARQQPQPQAQLTPKNVEETRNLIAATNEQIARQGGVKENAADRVDPYPRSAGMVHQNDAAPADPHR
jgi:hypothetical protein